MSASTNDDGARRGEDDHSHDGADERGEKGEKHAASADSSAPQRATLEGLASGGFDGALDRIIVRLPVADIFALLLTNRAFREAARRAGEEGQRWLRLLYERGEAQDRGLDLLKQDKEAGRADIEAAARGGLRSAIATCKWRGWGCEGRDREGAVALWKAEHASGSTCKWCAYYLAHCYRHGLGGVEKDEARAVELFHEAADQRGNSAAMGKLGVFYANGQLGIEVDEAEALNYYRSASDAGDACTSGQLAEHHKYGRQGLDINLEEAARLFNIAKERHTTNTAYWTRRLNRVNAEIAAKRQQHLFGFVSRFEEEKQGDEQ